MKSKDLRNKEESMVKVGKKKSLWLFVLSVVMIMCLTVATALLPKSKAFADETGNYKYLLGFEDDFEGKISKNWAVVSGGSSYAYTEDGKTVKGWRFNGENHIAYSVEHVQDYGKFLYGTKTSSNYVFEVKMKADVDETLGEFLAAHTVDGKLSVAASDLTINTNLPFFVTNASPDSNYHTYKGRSVCISNYAIGFYEIGEETSGWAKSTRIKSAFSDDFDWRDWHTIRVEATDEECSLWLDGVLMMTVAQSEFTRSTATSGYCGFVGNSKEGYAALHFDDFKYWKANADYDSTLTEVETAVSSLDAADFRDSSKIAYISQSLRTGLEATDENKLLYNTDGELGTDMRLLKEYSYTSFETAVAFDIERQKTAKGVAADGSYSGSTQVRTSDLSGILFNGSFDTSGKYNGYLLNYWASYYTTTKTNTVTLQLKELSNNSTVKSNTIIGVLGGTTSCVLDVKVEGGYLYLTVYKTKEDWKNGVKGTLTGSAAAVTEENGVYKLALPTYDESTGGDYTEGNFGFRCQSGGTGNRFTYDAEILSFGGKATVAATEIEKVQPVAKIADRALEIVTPVNGSVTVNGVAASGTRTVKAHEDVKLTFVPADGYVVDRVKINGVDVSAVSEFTISNITSDYTVEATFTNVKKVSVYILAGQSNAAGFTPVNSFYKPYTYGGTLNEEKLAEYEAGYTDVLYYGITKAVDAASADIGWKYVTTGKGQNAQMTGPELGFAEGISGYYGGENGKAAVVKFACGSTGFQYRNSTTVKTYGNWYSPTAAAKLAASGIEAPETTGLLYENLLITVRRAVESLLEQGYEPEIKGMFWLQGCEDASWEDLAYSYQEHLTDLINDLRSDVTTIMTELSYPQDCSETPFVIGKIGADLQKAEYESVVREQMQQTALALKNVRIVESEGFVLPDENDNNDVWHFSGKGILGMGNRFADVLAQMVGLKDVVAHDVTFDSNGGSEVASQTVAHWMSVAVPEEPTKSGYTFLGWYADGAGAPYDFAATPLTENLKLTAKWERDESQFAVTVKQSENGALSVDKEYAKEGESVTVTVTPADGYELVSVLVNGQAIEGTSFTVSGETEVTAEFAKKATKKKGCGSTAALGGVSVALASVCVAALKKRKRK